MSPQTHIIDIKKQISVDAVISINYFICSKLVNLSCCVGVCGRAVSWWIRTARQVSGRPAPRPPDRARRCSSHRVCRSAAGEAAVEPTASRPRRPRRLRPRPPAGTCRAPSHARRPCRPATSDCATAADICCDCRRQVSPQPLFPCNDRLACSNSVTSICWGSTTLQFPNKSTTSRGNVV